MNFLKNNSKSIIINFNDGDDFIGDKFNENTVIGYLDINAKEINIKKDIFNIEIDNLSKPKHIFDLNNGYINSINKTGNLIHKNKNYLPLKGETFKNISVINKKNNELFLPKAQISLLKGENAIQTLKIEKDELKNALFEMFSNKPEMTFDEINSVLDQSRNYLGEVLLEICDKRKERNKYLYYLKQIYTVHDDTNFKKKYKNK